VKRRDFLKQSGLIAAGLPLWVASSTANDEFSLLKPPRLRPGDGVGLVSPGGIITDADELQDAKDTLTGLGLHVHLGKHALDQWGYFAGRDEDRVADLHAMFADPDIKMILCTRGGSGASRLLPLMDYSMIRANPKIFMGYSDVTAILLAVATRTGLVTFHGPVGISTWNAFSVRYVQEILMDGQAMTLRNPPDEPVNTITPGRSQGRLMGGNLSVLAGIMGSEYVPSWEKIIFFFEEVEEEIYRIDRMLMELKLTGLLDRAAGVIVGQCQGCKPSDEEHQFTLQEVLAHYLQPLGVPAWTEASFGHVKNKFTLPVGLPVEIDAVEGSIRLLESAVV
jgi:muramoyltetrapeptide carboxypeptidase